MAPGITNALAAYRYRVFVETLGWDLPVQGNAETDEFDGPHTMYVIARNERGEICGCARLLPTTGSYLLAKVFPQLLQEAPPVGSDVWELSRFASMDCGAPDRLSHQELKVAEQLLAAALEHAAKRGVKRFITVSPLGVERLLRRAGVHAHRAGPPVAVNGQHLFACWIEVDRQSIHALRQGLGHQAPVAPTKAPVSGPQLPA
ncbi:N-acyl-L-homoserine lactone synthetase [Caldimonas brevitalea]|uniref:Acyl-homoserine-lactone synthase n=1 Tax=Caldimonas brevitalea TaxID=413882 RepID=A0A0G3BFT5_9BURK|nr:N-acyl-L-homoserine lactone synthetase [Caldimonas brevitalea]